MGVMKSFSLFFGLFLFLGVFTIYVTVLSITMYDYVIIEQGYDNSYMKIFNGNDTLAQDAVGVYLPYETMCIMIGDRETADVFNTTCHETCHYLVHKEPEHFCGWYN